jgi:hypothetical protein
LLLTILKSWGIPCGLNPYSGTEDPRRADYDVWLYSPDSLTIEVKNDEMSYATGNVCIELAALHHSKAGLFAYFLPFQVAGRKKLYVHAFFPQELSTLTIATKLTPQGRFYTYRHTRVGDQENNVGVLVPREVLRTVGRPFGEAIRLMTN